MAYRFIQKHSCEFGVRWLLKRLNIYPNAYYNYLKNRKKKSIEKKEKTKKIIKEIFHSNNGIFGHRQIKILLKKIYDINISKTTTHKYMNKEMKLFSIVRVKRLNYKKSRPHKIFANLLNQNFTASEPNKIWCTDFFHYRTEEEIYESIEEFSYIWYNHVRPHSYNDYMAPYEKKRDLKSQKRRKI